MNNPLIKLHHLQKKFSNQILFNDISIEIDAYGFYGLEGESGCGKSSLLFILGLLDNAFQGKYFYKGKQVKKREEIIRNSMGFAFQNAVFFYEMTVLENLSLFHEKYDLNEIYYLLDFMGLIAYKNELVKKLSGGERMRLAIVRAFLGSPEIVFLDEPTAALDKESTELVMKFLKQESSKRCIFMVSHDHELLQNYVDDLFLLKNGQLTHSTLRKKIQKEEKDSSFSSDGKLSFSFFLKYFHTCFKRKKMNAFFCILSIFFCLFTIGFSFLLTLEVEEELKNSFTTLMEEDQILLKKEDSGKTYEKITISENEAQDLLQNLPSFHRYGFLYQGDFESQFPDKNCLIMDATETIFHEFDLRTLSETICMEDLPLDVKVYPYRPNSLLPDEGVLGLKRSDIKKICMALNLKNTDEFTLSNYLSYHSINFSFFFENEQWNYRNEIPFRLKAFFIVDARPLIAHTNPFFTTYIFEEKMKLPTSDDLIRQEYLPWTIKKATFLQAEKGKDADALKEYFQSDFYAQYDLSKNTDVSFSHPILKEKNEKYIVTYASEGKLTYKEALKIAENKKENLFPIALPYSVSEEILASGFLNTFFLSATQENLNEIQTYYDDQEENIDQVDITNFNFGEKVAAGNLISAALKKGIRLSFSSPQLLYGNKADNYHEIEISTCLAKKLFGAPERAINQRVYSSFHTYKENKNQFIFSSMIVSGVFEDNSELIAQDLFWYPILCALDFDYELSDIRISSYLMKSSSSPADLKNQFSEYQFSNPLEDIFRSIDQVLEMLQTILFAFTFLLTMSSLGILFLTIQSALKDAAKEIGLLKCLGVKKSSIGLLYFFTNILYSFFGFLSSLGVLIFVDKIVQVGYFNKPLDFSLPVPVIAIVSFVAFLLSVPLTILMISFPLKKSSLKLLKQYY